MKYIAVLSWIAALWIVSAIENGLIDPRWYVVSFGIVSFWAILVWIADKKINRKEREHESRQTITRPHEQSQRKIV